MLTIQHVVGSDPPAFRLLRADGTTSEDRRVTSPFGFPVKDCPHGDLMSELSWYFGSFHRSVPDAHEARAHAVCTALSIWGQQAFSELFGNGQGAQFFRQAIEQADGEAYLRISCDEPAILAWPWEALRDFDPLALLCRIDRFLNQVADARESTPEALEGAHINILLVTARPYEGDVDYLAVSGPLVDLIISAGLPAQITLLRPPTFSRLREHLDERRGHYHILHFDGQGGYQAGAMGGASRQGCLLFETDQGAPEPVTAAQLRALLHGYGILGIVLNACGSEARSVDTVDAFVSVSGALIRAGIRSVVAVAHPLTRDAARYFLSQFYRRLFESGSFADATLAGRQKLFEQPQRVFPGTMHRLEDWVLPVLYQREPVRYAVPAQTDEDARVIHPARAFGNHSPYGFIGRADEVHKLERAMQRPPAALLLSGCDGIGKTKLVHGFANWLVTTGGVAPERVVWVRFDETPATPEQVLDTMGQAVLGDSFLAGPPDTRLDNLVRTCRRDRHLIIWDDFDLVGRSVSRSADPPMLVAVRSVLIDLLERLRNSESKMILTSTTQGAFFGPANCFVVPVAGLRGQERWELCTAILRDFGHRVEQGDNELRELVDMLDGHAHAMRIVLPELSRRSADDLYALVHEQLQAAGTNRMNPSVIARIVAALLPEDLAPLLAPLSLHAGLVQADELFRIARAGMPDRPWTRTRVDALLQWLCHVGLLEHLGGEVYEMHALLDRHLRGAVLSDAEEQWPRAFVQVMTQTMGALMAKARSSNELRRLRTNVDIARLEAQRLGMSHELTILTELFLLDVANDASIPKVDAGGIELLKDRGNEMNDRTSNVRGASGPVLGRSQRDQLVKLLQECRAVRERLSEILDRLPFAIQGNISSAPELLAHLRSIVNICVERPDGMAQLREAVFACEGETYSMIALDRFLRSFI